MCQALSPALNLVSSSNTHNNLKKYYYIHNTDRKIEAQRGLQNYTQKVNLGFSLSSV